MRGGRLWCSFDLCAFRWERVGIEGGQVAVWRICSNGAAYLCEPYVVKQATW